MARRIAALPPLASALAPGVSALVSAIAHASARRAAPASAPAPGRWTADLAPPPGDAGPTGHAVVERGRRPGELRLRLVVSGDTPGARRTWRLRDPDATGDPATADLRINARGNGVATLVLPPALRDPARLVVELLHLGAVLASGPLAG